MIYAWCFLVGFDIACILKGNFLLAVLVTAAACFTYFFFENQAFRAWSIEKGKKVLDFMSGIYFKGGIASVLAWAGTLIGYTLWKGMQGDLSPTAQLSFIAGLIILFVGTMVILKKRVDP